jgi:isopenicillin N synthase-like dioxygenase
MVNRSSLAFGTARVQARDPGVLRSLDALAIRLLRIMARNLGMPPDFLDAHFRPQHTSFLRLNYYPRCTINFGGRLGVNPHTDAGAITLLLQDEQPGLQISIRTCGGLSSHIRTCWS